MGSNNVFTASKRLIEAMINGEETFSKQLIFTEHLFLSLFSGALISPRKLLLTYPNGGFLNGWTAESWYEN